MNNSVNAAGKLATKIYWLKRFLAIATTVGTVAAVAQLFLRK